MKPELKIGQRWRYINKNFYYNIGYDFIIEILNLENNTIKGQVVKSYTSSHIDGFIASGWSIKYNPDCWTHLKGQEAPELI